MSTPELGPLDDSPDVDILTPRSPRLEMQLDAFARAEAAGDFDDSVDEDLSAELKGLGICAARTLRSPAR